MKLTAIAASFRIINNDAVNPRPAGLLDFPPPARRGCVEPPFISAPGLRSDTRGKRHSKERQKSSRNYFGNFLGQVKAQVTRGQQRSNLAYFNIFRQTGAKLGNYKS